MTGTMSTLIIYSLAAVGVASAIIAFLKTPREQRYRAAHASLEEQLKSLPASAEAVIIKGDKKRALVKSAPVIVIAIVMSGFSHWATSIVNPECERLFGFNAAYILLLLVSYGIPIIAVVVSLIFAAKGVEIIRTGYFPPLGSVVFNDTIAKKGPASMLHGVAHLALPVFALYGLYIGNNLYMVFSRDKNGHEIHETIEKLEAKCSGHAAQ